jgi:hypothetical protein
MPSLHAISIAAFTRGLRNLDHLLARAAASGIDEAALTEARIADDMFPLTRQVQIACDTPKLAAMRLGQLEPLPMPDEETTLAELRGRIARTIAYLEAADPAAFEGREDAEIVVKFPNGEQRFTGLSYVTDFALPNFYFHVTTAYDLLRMKGVALGKLDYLAGSVAAG